MRLSITSNLRIYQRIANNMFAIGKNLIMNTLEILRISQNFKHYLIFSIFITAIRCFTPVDKV